MFLKYFKITFYQFNVFKNYSFSFSLQMSPEVLYTTPTFYHLTSLPLQALNMQILQLIRHQKKKAQSYSVARVLLMLTLV